VGILAATVVAAAALTIVGLALALLVRRLLGRRSDGNGDEPQDHYCPRCGQPAAMMGQAMHCPECGLIPPDEDGNEGATGNDTS